MYRDIPLNHHHYHHSHQEGEEREEIDIVGLLRWAFRDQGIGRGADSRDDGGGWDGPGSWGADSVLRVQRAAALGAVRLTPGPGAPAPDRERPSHLPDALVVARYWQAMPGPARRALQRGAWRQPDDAVWPAAPALKPLKWRRRQGQLVPQCISESGRPVLLPLTIEPDPGPLLHQAEDYAQWWDALACLHDVLLFERWEFQSWHLVPGLPPAPATAPAWATGWTTKHLHLRNLP